MSALLAQQSTQLAQPNAQDDGDALALRYGAEVSLRGARAWARRDTLGFTRCAMQSSECRSVRYWSEEINGTLTGGQKK